MMLKKTTFRLRGLTFIAFILLSEAAAQAQLSYPANPESRDLIIANEQFRQGHYAVAAQSARAFLGSRPGKTSVHSAADADLAKYILAMAALKTDAPGAKDSAVIEREATLNPAYKDRLGFGLAQFYFQHNDHAKAIPYYESSGETNLEPVELADKKFELAYCYFNDKQFGKAEPLFAAIKELKDGKYYPAANYYYGLLAYNKNKYKEALHSFDLIKDVKEYKSVVPYYIAEIYYFMGSREKALSLAETLIKSKEKSFYHKELHLLAAQCLFEEQKYREAHPYFDYYYEHTDKIRKQDLYEMAYCDYRIDEWATAIEKFKLLNSTADSLGQTAMYLLGDCYLKTGDKPSARNAYGICADMTFNAGQQEASMILYARISYETGYNDEALRQLYNLLKVFPASQYRDEANTMISGLLVRTNNFAEALKHLEAVSKKEQDYWQVYQKANFGYAVEQYRKEDIANALKYFDRSLEHPVNNDFECASYFWKSEIAFHEHQYSDAISYAQEFIGKLGKKKGLAYISPLATAQHAYLNMGYAALESKNYAAAQGFFNHAQEQNDDPYTGMVAMVREADAVFMQRNYSKAIALYDKIISKDTKDADYARYQKGILLGLLGKNSEKISMFQFLIGKKPASAYGSFARYELALTYLENDKYSQALPYLKYLTDTATDKSFAPKAWMKRGFIYQETDMTAQAIEAYKQVVINYPASEDRFSAMEALRSLYIESNKPGEYSRLLKDNNLPSAEGGSVDSTYYAAAETQFANGKIESAHAAFTDYLKEYPHGIFELKAHYYRAECNFHLKKYKEAKEDYQIVLKGPWNEFLENSSRHAATIAYEEKDFALAFEYYLKLATNSSTSQMKELAYSGIVRSGFQASKYHEVAEYADSLMAVPGVSAENMNDALYFKARSIQYSDSTSDQAMEIYDQLSDNKNGVIAAESRYRIAELLFNQGKLKEAESAANESIHLSAGYDYWIAKSYLLLADILVKQNDYFNAKALLESIVKHTKIAETKQEAGKKLELVKKLEKKKSKLSEE